MNVGITPPYCELVRPPSPNVPNGPFKQWYIQRPPSDVRPTDSGRSVYASTRTVNPTQTSPSPTLAGYATFCILFAKSRPEVGGGSALPSFR